MTSLCCSQNFFLGLNVFLSAFGGHGMSLCVSTAHPTCLLALPTRLLSAPLLLERSPMVRWEATDQWFHDAKSVIPLMSSVSAVQ